MNIKNNLILALDVTDKDKAIEICKEVSPYINTIKIGYPLTLAEGLEIIKIIKVIKIKMSPAFEGGRHLNLRLQL